MQFYLAHNFAARDFLKLHVIPTLETMGHKVVARWITDDFSWVKSDEDKAKCAMDDFLDLSAADYLVHFCDQYGKTPGRGKFVEVGYALACGKRIIVQGEDRESSVFYFMQNVNRFRYIDDMYVYLSTLPKG